MNKQKKVIVIMLLLLLTSGCTSYKQYDNKQIKDSDTGQRIVENILCKTEATQKQYNRLKEESLIEIDKKLENNEITEEEHKIKTEEINELYNIKDVTSCDNFSVMSGEDDGLWTNVFVKSLSWLIIKIGSITKNYGWAIIIVTILIRLALFPITKKTAAQSENMKKVQPKLAKLEEKYRNKTDQQSQMQKSQEMMKIYKDNNINPASGCLFAFIQIPLFFAFYESLYRLPVVLEENFLGINLGITPLTAFQMGKYYYIIFIILVVVATYYSFKLNSAMNANSEQAKQMKMMTNFSIIMISVASITISIGIALYWITNSSFTIVQNLLVKRGKKNDNIS